MRPLVVLLLVVSFLAGATTLARAQATHPAPDTAVPALRPDVAPRDPATERPQDAGRGETPDDPAALPRRPVGRTTIFGLSPAGAAVMAVSLLVVVVLSVVAMTRRDDAYLDPDRHE